MPLKLENLHILVVEDTLPMLRLVNNVLETLGVGLVTEAKDGQQGLDVTRKIDPDIIICDWEMPNVDGLQFTREIRTNPFYPDRTVPIVMLSGYGMASRVAEARDTGVTEFIVKPFTAEDLTKRIMYVVNHPRDFIECDTYAGPDRRRKADPHYSGPFRRHDDNV